MWTEDIDQHLKSSNVVIVSKWSAEICQTMCRNSDSCIFWTLRHAFIHHGETLSAVTCHAVIKRRVLQTCVIVGSNSFPFSSPER